MTGDPGPASDPAFAELASPDRSECVEAAMADQLAIREIAERNMQLLAAEAVAGTPDLRHQGAPRRRPALRDRGGPLAASRPTCPPRSAATRPRRRPACSAAARWRAASRSGSPPGPRAWACRSMRSRSRSRPTSTRAASWASGRRSARLHARSATSSRSRARRPGTSWTGSSSMAERHSPYLDVFGRADGARAVSLRLNGEEA